MNIRRSIVACALLVCVLGLAALLASCSTPARHRGPATGAPGSIGGAAAPSWEEAPTFDLRSGQDGGARARFGPPGGGQGIGGGGFHFDLDRWSAPGDETAPLRAPSGEELWIIQRPAAEAQPPRPDDDHPGTGALMARLPDEPQKDVPVPLKHTAVKTGIAGYIATTDVTQQFHNPFESKIEAVYVFPLPANAAINEFVMTIGERRIRGIIREREEATQIYHQARQRGHVASLLTQERPNVFTQSVANIEPGREIDIHIRYFHTLTYVDGWHEYVFPMVVGPRFNPTHISDGIGAVGRGRRGASGQSTEVQYLHPSERSGHDIALEVELNAGVEIEQLQSINHQIRVEEVDETTRRIALDPADAIPNKDFVLRYRVAGEQVKTALLTHRDDSGGYFTLMIYPPADMTDLPQQPLEMVFTIDISGSMSGKPIEQAKDAAAHALRQLGPSDTFQVIRFASGTELMTPRPVPATPENVRRGLKFIEESRAGGGTWMLDGIIASLDFPPDQEGRLRFVAFLTDGYIGNESEILREVHHRLGPSRIFSFGVGSSPNRYLMDEMARAGNGAAAYLSLNEKGSDVMDLFFQRIRRPALAQMEIDWGMMQVSDVYPQRLPDLFVGRPVILTGRFTGDGETTIRLRGMSGGRAQEIAMPVNPTAGESQNPAIAAAWARAKIADLSELALREPDADVPVQIRQVAMEHGLMSAFTAFVAVDSTGRTEGEFGTTVAVPVPVPDGVRYETTVRE